MIYRVIIQDRTFEEIDESAAYLSENYSPEFSYVWLTELFELLDTL